jgi:hypothetical protein
LYAAPNRIGLLVLLSGLALTGSAAAPAQVARPTVTLLTPANGSLLEGAASTAASVTFSWRVDGVPAANGPSGSVTVTHRIAADPTFTLGVTTTSQTCPTQNVNCWASATPRRSYEAGRYYWQVLVNGGAFASSQTWMFQAAAARPKPDLRRPKVQALAGTAKRGRKALFAARVADDHGEARMQVELLYRHQLVFRAMTLLRPVRWSVKQHFDSRTRLPRSLPLGRYRLCVTAWDRTGNRALSCARYTVR